MTRPLCRYCGKPIAKRTLWHPIATSDPAPPLSKADCQARTNEIVVSVSYGRLWRPHDIDSKIRVVRSFNTWDGESYVDPWFCRGGHAEAFAYAAIRQAETEGRTIAMAEYHDAIKRQKETA